MATTGCRRRKVAHVDFALGPIDLAPVTTARWRRPRVGRDLAQLDRPADAAVGDSPIPPHRRVRQGLAFVAGAHQPADISQQLTGQVAERQSPAEEPTLARVVGVHVDAWRERLAEVGPHPLGRLAGARADHQRDEAGQRVDVASPRPWLPLRPLLGHPSARPHVHQGVCPLRQPRSRETGWTVEALAVLLGDKQPRPEPVRLRLRPERPAVPLPVDLPPGDLRLAGRRP